SSYYRRDAIRQLARLKRSAELTQAILKLLKKMENDSLQRDVMDLTVSFTVAEAVNLIVPIAIGSNENTRFAIGILARIGGPHAYKTLNNIVNTKQGFSLEKSSAIRSLKELLRREPELAKEDSIEQTAISTESSSDGNNSLVGNITDKVESHVSDMTSSATKIIPGNDPKIIELEKRLTEGEAKLSKADSDKLHLKNEIHRLSEQLKSRALQHPSTTISDKQLRQENHKLRESIGRVTANYEKRIATLEELSNDLESELDKERSRGRRTNRDKPENKSVSAMGSVVLIITFIVFFIFFTR
ncbi:MAG: hypothetical protein HRT88_12945, partial [Lentisphaeraceae bacterium]|nr:hypothetical protein [Lentisphaeraceae bacterium]